MYAKSSTECLWITSPRNSSPVDRITETRRAPSTTWRLVTTSPLSLIMKPVPDPEPVVICNTLGSACSATNVPECGTVVSVPLQARAASIASVHANVAVTLLTFTKMILPSLSESRQYTARHLLLTRLLPSFRLFPTTSVPRPCNLSLNFCGR